MDLPFIEVLLRAATFALAIAAAVAVLLRQPRGQAAGYAAFAIAGIAAFVLASARGALQQAAPAVFFANAWCLATPAVAWLLALMLFRDGFRPGPAHLCVVGAVAVAAFAGDWGRFALGPLGSASGGGATGMAPVVFVAARVASVGLLAIACIHAALHWRADLVEERRRARGLFVASVCMVFGVLSVSELVFGRAGAPLEARLVGIGLLLVLTFALLQAIARGALDAVLAPPRTAPPALVVVGPTLARGAPATGGMEAALARRVVGAMETGRLWKRDGLAIASLAAELGTQEYLLRRAINRHLGYRNFNDFLHDYRLREAAQRLGDPAQRHLPVLTIALDCGYGSIGPFNRAFKARFGVTPTQYRHIRETSPNNGVRTGLADREPGSDSGFRATLK